jgi:hypothetical protein
MIFQILKCVWASEKLCGPPLFHVHPFVTCKFMWKIITSFNYYYYYYYYYYYITLCSVFAIIYLQYTMFLGYTLLQLFCSYNLEHRWCSFPYFIIIFIIISFMQGIYTYIPETNHVPREYSVSAILSLLFMVSISLVPALALLLLLLLLLLL